MNKNLNTNTNNMSDSSSREIEGSVVRVEVPTQNMNDENIDGIQVKSDTGSQPDPNSIGSGSTQNLRRDVEGAVLDDSSMCVVIPGQMYGEPPKDILLLQDYFRKPVLISTLSWTTATTVQSINPYSLWENLAVINSKFGYYNKRSYNLKLSFSLAASPYHIGAAVIDWNPSNRGSATTAGHQVGYQRRHVLLTPDQSYWELSIPHFSSTPYNVGSAVVSTSKGTIYFAPQFALARVDGAAPGIIAVVIRAWTEDMVLTEPSFIQTMKSNIGKAAESAVNEGVSFLKPLFKTADSIAHLLGFSVVNDTKTGSMSMKNAPNLSSTSGSRPIEVLTTSENNMISPLPLNCGISDPLTIASICSRRGLARLVTSYTTTSAVGDVLVNIPVTPLVAYSSTGFTPLGYVSNLFNYWVGSIAFTITIISSPLQQGAILITHEPSDNQPTSGNNSQAASTARSCIMDISTSKKKTVLVSSVGGTNELLLTRITASGIATDAPTAVFSTACDAGSNAGFLSISVNKALIAPGASSCYIIVEVAAGPDFQLIDYCPENIDSYDYTMLSIKPNTVGIQEDICDLRTKIYRDIRETHSGEKVLSLRPLLNRQSLVQTAVVTVKADNPGVAPILYTSLNLGRFITIQNFKGDTESNAQGYQQDFHDIFNFVSSMFCRRTGGHRVMVRVSYRTTSSSPQFLSISRTVGSLTAQAANNSFYASTTRGYNTTGSESLGGQNYPGGIAMSAAHMRFSNGTAITDCRTNPFVSIEDTPVTLSPYMPDTSVYELRLELRDVYPTETYISVYRAAKQDIQFYEFVGVPLCTSALGTGGTYTSISGITGSIV